MSHLLILAAVLELAGWKGETVSFRLDHVSAREGAFSPRWESAPAGWEVHAGVMRGVRYLTQVHGTEYGYAPDRVEWNGATNLPPNGSCIAVGQVKIPAGAKAAAEVEAARKAAEILAAFDLEQMYSKDDILELYINTIYCTFYNSHQ